jgi:hypothetical protein
MKRLPLIVLIIMTIIFSWLIWHNIFYMILAVFAVCFFYASGETFMDFVRMRTSILLTDDGCRRSFRHIDKTTISSPFEKDYDYVIYATGGSDYPWFPFRGGMLDWPFIIVPKEFIISTDGGSSGQYASGNIHDMSFDALPEFIQQALQRHPSGHFNKQYSIIKMIDVSYINLSDTSENINLASQRDKWTEAYNNQKELNGKLIDQIRALTSLQRNIDETEKVRYVIMPDQQQKKE